MTGCRSGLGFSRGDIDQFLGKEKSKPAAAVWSPLLVQGGFVALGADRAVAIRSVFVSPLESRSGKRGSLLAAQFAMIWSENQIHFRWQFAVMRSEDQLHFARGKEGDTFSIGNISHLCPGIGISHSATLLEHSQSGKLVQETGRR